MNAPPVDGFIAQGARGVISGRSAASEHMDGCVSKPIDQGSLCAAVEG
jgi:hypothetical protein